MPGERTEPGTAKRRGDARAKGQVLKSTEVNTAVGLLAGAWVLQVTMPSMAATIVDFSRQTFGSLAASDMSSPTVVANTMDLTLILVRMVGPVLLALMAAAVISNLSQVGLMLNGQNIKPQFSKINPLSGAQRLFTSKSLVELFKTLAKIAVIGTLAWQAMHDKGVMLAVLSDMQPGMAGATVTDATMAVVWRVIGAFAIIAILDYVYQRWSFEKGLRMSIQDIKEEMKQAEGDPRIKGRLRQRARALSRQRMMQEVPKADVVVTNPTHFAVALKYEEGMDAPIVIAKGQRLIAQQIKKIAREHGVPLVENRPLAQALFKGCELGQQVPPDLFKAVAEVLAFVYRLRPDRAPAGHIPAPIGQAAA